MVNIQSELCLGLGDLSERKKATISLLDCVFSQVELTDVQKKYYRAILERNFSFLSLGANSNSNVPNLLNTMMELRKCCNHPYLINGTVSHY